MTVRASVISVVVVALIYSDNARADAQDPSPELTETLALPVSVGSIAMLARVAGHPLAQGRLRDAIKNGDPDIRTVAARVVTATASRGLLPDIRAQLARDSDALATTELLRALAIFGAASDDAALVDAAKRTGSTAVEVLAESLARVRPESLEAWAPDLAMSAPYGVGARLAVACAQRPELVARMAAASQRAGKNAWTQFLDQRHDNGGQTETQILLAALTSPDNEIRLSTAHYVVAIGGRDGEEVDRSVVETVAAWPASSANTPTWNDAYAELARRALKRPARELDWRALVSSDLDTARQALRGIRPTLLGDGRGGIEKLLGKLTIETDHVERLDRQTGPPQIVRTVPLVAGNLLGDLMAVNHCRGSDTTFAIADITHRHDGRALTITLADRPLSAECRRVAEAMFSLALAPLGYTEVSGANDRVLVPMDTRFVQCSRARPLLVESPPPKPARVEPPLLRERPQFIYPNQLRAENVRGLIRVIAEISQTACVRSVEVDRSPNFLLAFEAVRVQLGTTFSPMKVEGVAKPCKTSQTIAIAPP